MLYRSRRRFTPLVLVFPLTLAAAAGACGQRSGNQQLPEPELAPRVESRAPSSGSEARLALIAGGLVDGSGGAPLRGDVVVVVRGDRIESVGLGSEAPSGAETLDLRPSYLLPGLIDAHVHPLASGDDYQIDQLKRSSAYKALRGQKRLAEAVQAGWTTVRIAGDADTGYAAMDLKRAVEDRLFVGPRVSGAAHYLSITGGGGDINFISHEQHIHADGRVVDGRDEVRKAVREEVKYGSDWVKILVTGAFMSSGDNPRNVQFSREELDVAVAEANRLGVPVMAHAHATDGIKMAVLAGVRSIEHGTFIDEEAMRLMIERGTYLVPTLYIGERYLAHHQDSPHQQKMVELTKKYRAGYLEKISTAIELGVRVVVGSDAFGFPIEEGGVGEMLLLEKLGMSPSEVIRAATSGNAELLGWSDRLGTIAPGKLADIIAVPGDPTIDLKEVARVEFVMLGGRVVRGKR